MFTKKEHTLNTNAVILTMPKLNDITKPKEDINSTEYEA
jgi:hypothetical protein